MMPPDRQRRPGTAVTVNRSAEAFVVDYTTNVEATATTGPGAWHLEAEESLRDAGRKLEALGVTDTEAARLARAVLVFASRVRSDRTGVRP